MIIVGIVQDTMIVDGHIFRVLQPGIEGYLMTGEITIETTGGTDDLGVIIPSLTVTSISIGGAVKGEMTIEGDISVNMEVIPPGIVVIVVATVDMKVVIMIDTRDN